VVIIGTEYCDGKSRRYVDIPITDVLQIMGRAGRLQYDDHGVAYVFVHDIKVFYKYNIFFNRYKQPFLSQLVPIWIISGGVELTWRPSGTFERWDRCRHHQLEVRRSRLPELDLFLPEAPAESGLLRLGSAGTDHSEPLSIVTNPMLSKRLGKRFSCQVGWRRTRRTDIPRSDSFLLLPELSDDAAFPG